MVKFFTSTYTYDYTLPAVSLAYFLRYPNPLATHVLSTDTISSSLDPGTGRLRTLRIHRKSSRLPTAILKLLPSSVLAGGKVREGKSESFILESSEIDVREGWMRCESRNLDWTGVLSVVERQEFHARSAGDTENSSKAKDKTDVKTTVMFRSRLGERLRGRAAAPSSSLERKSEPDREEKKGFLSNWSTIGIQRSIEAIASRRTEIQLGKAKEGMMIVLERLRLGGLGGVMDGMRQDGLLVGRE